MIEPKEINILLVEDTEEHALLVRRGLEDGVMKHRLFLARDGQEALDFLFNRAEYANQEEYPRPDVILLDLRLPRVSGIEVLEKLSAEERLKGIPVVVLTASDQRDDILRSIGAGARSYVLKSG
ncbi:MAG: response regulator, partial [Chloroflexi bacterium]|nr:response regulator [Chloroflexota bacterium]